MKITVRIKDIEIEVNDNDNCAVIKYEIANKELHKTIKLICEEALKILKERNN